VSIPKIVGDALAHPSWLEAMLDVLFRIVELANSFLYLMGNLLLVTGEFLLSKLLLMVLLIASKLVLLLKIIHKYLV